MVWCGMASPALSVLLEKGRPPRGFLLFPSRMHLHSSQNHLHRRHWQSGKERGSRGARVTTPLHSTPTLPPFTLQQPTSLRPGRLFAITNSLLGYRTLLPCKPALLHHFLRSIYFQIFLPAGSRNEGGPRTYPPFHCRIEACLRGHVRHAAWDTCCPCRRPRRYPAICGARSTSEAFDISSILHCRTEARTPSVASRLAEC